MVASRVGGFVDQIEDGVTGFFIDPQSCETMGQTLQQVLNLPEEQRASIRRRAYDKVVRLYDFEQNFPATLRWFWGRTTHGPLPWGARKPDVHLCVRTCYPDAAAYARMLRVLC